MCTNGPRKHVGGGNNVHKCATAGGCGNAPPTIIRRRDRNLQIKHQHIK